MIEQLELALTAPQPRARRAELGQFMTPAPIARFMASLFEPAPLKRAKLLDAGAGEGALSAAFIERRAALGLERIDAHAYELDATVYPALCRNLKRGEGCVPHPFNADFIEQASALRADFTHAILNPPYKKISASSAYRRMLSGAGIETVNLYSGFVALALSLLAPGGQLVAIIPRSFCNGPYYRPFRQWIFERAAIRRIHLFESRTSPFKEDEVLQETVIIHLERGAAQGEVILSSSTGAELDVVETRATPFEQIVHTGDAERFIHIPTTAHGERREEGLGTFEGLGIKVSTGPVVDFRLREQLRDSHEAGCAPLLYPLHMEGQRIRWPIEGAKKPNAILIDEETRRWLYPRGYYCVVRRFSSKEERRRIVASVVTPELCEAELVGFENHINVFHAGRAGLPQALAYGLAAYLNTSEIDEAFRQFNGHTQVNVTDLKALRYPSRDKLMELGGWAMERSSFDTSACDARWEALR